MKDAIFAMQTGKFADSVSLLNGLLAKDSKNLQAHYLLAVTYVNLRKYSEAAAQYKTVLQSAPNTPIGKLAADGLSKIPH
jgi:cytochrome c-type biogenesis protein CcmH/NrfG